MVTDWRERYEEKTRQGQTILHVSEKDGCAKEMAILNHDGLTIGIVASGAEHYLIPKPRPKTLRPYKRGEVRLGWAFRGKASGKDYMLTLIEENGACLNAEPWLYKELLENFTRINPATGQETGPAGVEE